MTPASKRENGLDVFRLLAAFGVITVHVGFFESFNSEEISSILRLSGRWAVPFFFILTGFLISRNNSSTRALSPLVKALTIFSIAFLLLIPLSVANYGFHETLARVFSSGVFLSGSYFHLWYLSSVVVGLLILLALEKQELGRLIPYVACISILMYLVMGAYNPLTESGIKVARHLSSVGFLYIGIKLKDIPASAARGLNFVIIGFIMQIIETQTLTYFLPGKNILKFQFLVGTVFFAIGAFDLARSLNSNSFDVLGKLGARHSLSIYIFHPYFIFAFKFLPISSYLSDLIIIPSVFLSSLLLSMLLDTYTPKFYKIVNGNLSFLKNK
ncbi:MAG: acyltransferase [Alteromonas stellipolaris]|uniref:acyltransferase family protein n=1 Tax=Alteromonas stellipolaris TaxID=233316 RepID=UPI003B8D04F2